MAMLFEEYLRNIPLMHSWDGGITWNTGGFGPKQLETLYNFLCDRLPNHPVILETGAGNSTITMLFLQPVRLISIAPDAQLFGRIRGFCQEKGISDTAMEAHIDGSQWVLPRLAADNRASHPILDFALIDGCHGWPTAFVDLEYTNSMLRQGGYLMIDDVQLHAEKEIARLLSEHPAFSLVLDLGKSLVFRKLTAERHLGEWVDQPYIVRRTREYARLPNPFALRDPRADLPT
jgi:predicted O-methyltransferase YrrM